MHAADSHLVGNHLDGEFRVAHILVDHLHHTAHQVLIRRLHFNLVDFLFLLLVAMELALKHLACLQLLNHYGAEHIYVERFRQVGIGTVRQSSNTVGVTAQRRHQHHWNVVGVEIRLDFLAEGQTIHHRHHHVAHHHVHLSWMGDDVVPSFLTVAARADHQFFRQLTVHILADGLVVLHEDGIFAVCVRRFVNGQHLCDLMLLLFGFWLCLFLRNHSAFKQIGTAHRHRNHELCALTCRVVLRHDGAVVEFHQHRCQVQSDSRSDVAILTAFGVEPLKHTLFVLILDAATRIHHFQLKVVLPGIKHQLDDASVRRELECVRKQVHHHLVHVRRIDKHVIAIHVVYKLILHVAALGIRLKHLKYILKEGHELHLAVFEEELSLFNLPHVHHLVHQTEYSVGVLLDQLIVMLAVGVRVSVDQLVERRHDEGHRCADLMADVHEELDARLIEFLLLAVVAQNPVCLHSTHDVGID